MPLMRYFVFVGGSLLALLWIVNACLPAAPVTQATRSGTTADLSVIRIHSDRKWPERVVFDTAQPTISAPVAAPVMAAAEPPVKALAPPLKTELREAFAQASRAHVEPKRKRKSIARNYYAGPPRIRLAQQPPAFFFGNNLW